MMTEHRCWAISAYYLSMGLYVCPSASLFFCLFICLSAGHCPFQFVSVHPGFVYLFVYLCGKTLCLSDCLTEGLSACKFLSGALHSFESVTWQENKEITLRGFFVTDTRFSILLYRSVGRSRRSVCLKHFWIVTFSGRFYGIYQRLSQACLCLSEH